MQKLISKYALAAHLALLAVASLLLSPICVFWLSGVCAIWLVMEPSRIGGESLHEARHRVLGRIVRDPFFWLMLIIVGLTGFRFFNDGVKMVYDAEIATWTISEPVFSLMPGAVGGRGGAEFAYAVAMLVVLTGCRHALGRSARHAFLLVASALSGLGAVTLATLYAMGNELMRPLVEMDVVLAPAFLGSAFGVYLLAGVAGLYGAFERKWLKAMLLTVLSVGGNAAGLFLFAPPTVTAAFAAATIILFLYAFVLARRRLPSSGEFKFLVLFSVSLTLAGVLVMSVLPDAALDERIAPFQTGAFFTETYLAVRDALSALSLKVWKLSPWLGTGLGSFPYDLKFHATEADWALVSAQQAAPLNGYWLLMTERGIIGAALIAVPLGFLLWTYFARLVKGIREKMPDPACWAGPLALAVVVAETFIDNSYTLPGQMLCVAVLLALAASSFPIPPKKKEKHGG